MHPTLTEENYLKAIFHLMNDKQQITVNDLSKTLNIKMPSVNSMMKKFAEKNWVKYEIYKPIQITSEGRKLASQVVRKHRLTEMFLVEVMGFGWENVHSIAEQLEHIHSEEFFDKMDEMLLFPTVDPHGEPIPDKDGHILERDLKKISQCQPGEEVVLKAVTLDSQDFLNYLNDHELVLGTLLKIIRKEKFDQSIMIEQNGKRQIFSEKVSQHLLVKSA